MKGKATAMEHDTPHLSSHNNSDGSDDNVDGGDGVHHYVDDNCDDDNLNIIMEVVTLLIQ